MTERVQNIRIGQVWQEVDPRFVGLWKTVTGFADDGRVLLDTGAVKTKAKPERFNGKRGGYRLIRDVQP